MTFAGSGARFVWARFLEPVSFDAAFSWTSVHSLEPRRRLAAVPRRKNIRVAFFCDGPILSSLCLHFTCKTMFKLAFVVALSVAARALGDCVPTFAQGAQYTVTMSELPSFGWVNNGTIGFLGVNLKTTVPPTQWFLSETGFGGYVFSIDTDMSSCLFASRNAKIPGSGKIFSGIGCFDGVGELDLDEDFTFSCVSCDANGGSNCFIKSSVTTECANTPDKDLDHPSGEDEEDQIVTAACAETSFQKWDVTLA
ncbi:hypothetical protein B0H19DRAFT_699837 [Mycena capillaripes]|nr:hypothetical protein B0H19DRAFT_699837 [Mycena capillaripes]